MSNDIAAKLIIENILNLEQANKLILEEIHPKVFGVMDKLIEESVTEFDDEMIGEYNFHEDTTWFLSKDWQQEPFQLEDAKSYKYHYASYQVWSYSKNDEANGWWLSNLFENEADRANIHFELWSQGFKKTGQKIWKAFYQEMNQKFPELEQTGFKFNTDGAWYLPIKSLDQKEVAENYVSDTLEDALTPITEALEIVQKAHPIFKKIVQKAIDRFGRYVDERETDDTPDTITNDANVATPSTAE